MLFFRRKLKTIDRSVLDEKISEFLRGGTCCVDENSDVVVSLTTFPQRISEIKYTLYSLLNQSVKPFRVVLYLAEDEFENVPEDVSEFLKCGLIVKFCKNIYSYKKLIPALLEFPEKLHVTADDDLFYDKDWLKDLVLTHEAYPDCVVAHRTHKIKLSAKLKNDILPFGENYPFAPYKKWKKQTNSCEPSYLNFLTSGAGVLFPNGCFCEDVLREDLFMRLAPKADDVWLWMMSVKGGCKIVSPKKSKRLTYVNPARERGLTGEVTLFSQNKNGGNDAQLRAVWEYYGKLR